MTTDINIMLISPAYFSNNSHFTFCNVSYLQIDLIICQERTMPCLILKSTKVLRLTLFPSIFLMANSTYLINTHFQLTYRFYQSLPIAIARTKMTEDLRKYLCEHSMINFRVEPTKLRIFNHFVKTTKFEMI